MSTWKKVYDTLKKNRISIYPIKVIEWKECAHNRESKGKKLNLWVHLKKQYTDIYVLNFHWKLFQFLFEKSMY
jgi:hypothetical protein